MTKKSICTHNRIFYGMVTISEKGQIALPVEIRRDLDIDAGDRFLVVKRRDDGGILLMKQNIMDNIIEKIQDDDTFLNKIKKWIRYESPVAVNRREARIYEEYFFQYKSLYNALKRSMADISKLT